MIGAFFSTRCGRPKCPGHRQRVVRRGSYEKVHVPGEDSARATRRSAGALRAPAPAAACRRPRPRPCTTAFGIPRAHLEPSAHWIAPGHERRAIASLMIATGGASGRSRSKRNGRGATAFRGSEEIRADLVSRRRQALGTVPSSRSTVRTCSLGFGEQIVDDAGALHTRPPESVRARDGTGRSVARGR